MTIHVARLDAVCEINPRTPKTLADDDAVSFLPMAAVSEDGHIHFEERREAGEVKKGYTYFERGDVLVAKITPCFENGKATRTETLANPVGFGSTEFHVLRAGREIDPSYLFHLIWNSKFREVGAKSMTGSAGQKRVPADFLKRLEIPLPPLDEQRRIAAILDKADDLRRKRKRAIELLDGLTQSIFLEMFGEDQSQWSHEPFRKLISEFRYGTSNKSDQSGFPVLRIPNVLGGNIDLSDLKFVPLLDTEFKRLQMHKGDLLLVRTNGNPDYVGRCAVFDDELSKISRFPLSEYVYASYLIRARLLNDKIAPHFVQSFLSSTNGRKALLERAKTSAGQFNINTEGLSSISIPVPPRHLQEVFVTRHKAVMNAMTKHSESSAFLDTLFTSLQHRAFSGQL